MIAMFLSVLLAQDSISVQVPFSLMHISNCDAKHYLKHIGPLRAHMNCLRIQFTMVSHQTATPSFRVLKTRLQDRLQDFTAEDHELQRALAFSFMTPVKTEPDDGWDGDYGDSWYGDSWGHHDEEKYGQWHEGNDEWNRGHDEE